MTKITPKLAEKRIDARTVTGWTILLLVLLRVGIGWHLCYEGIWKLKEGNWRATGYLLASVGPLRSIFVNMVDDPDGFDRLTKEDLSRRMDARYDTAVRHYGLDEKQQKILKDFVERKKHGIQDDNNVMALFLDEGFRKLVQDHRLAVAKGEPGHRDEIVKRIEAIFKDLDEAVKSGADLPQKAKGDPPPMDPIVPPGTPEADDLHWLTRPYLYGLMDSRYKALQNHYALTPPQHQSAKGWRYRDQKMVGGLRDRNYVDYLFAEPDYRVIDIPIDLEVTARAARDNDTFRPEMVAPDRDFLKRLADYRKLCREIKAMESGRDLASEGQEAVPDDEVKVADRATQVDYNLERLEFNYQKKNQIKTMLLNGQVNPPLQGAETPLKDVDPQKMTTFDENMWMELTPEQWAKGPMPGERSATQLIDLMNMWGLTIIGACLIVGLFTRFAAVCGAVLLTMYYLSFPPWPGVIENPMAEGHYLIVNKNLIEIIALLMLATSGVGRWLGVDAFIRAMTVRAARPLNPPQPISTPPPAGSGGPYSTAMAKR